MFRSIRGAASLLLLLGTAAPVIGQTAGAPAGAGGTAARRIVGSIHGKVTEKESGTPIVAAQVTVVGQRVGGISDNNGEYVIRNVPAGQVTVRATRIGYQPATLAVVVTDGGDITANFSLEHAVTRLEEVVTTATGSTTRREVGNAVAGIKADSIAQIAPVTTVNEMLQGRAAGVQILQGQGVLGASSSIRIRGTSSLSLSNEPLIVVDGIRFSNESEPGTTTVRINRFSTMDPEEIESIDVIKGPSASALYGTAAANGVVVIKTKRGSAGSTRWSAFYEAGATNMPAKYPANYWNYGHNLVNGAPTGSTIHCKVGNAAAGLCKIDSLSSFNPWTAAETDPWQNGPINNYGLQVSGGSSALKYFLSADRQGEIGPYHMPAFEQSRILSTRGTAPRSEQVRPNQVNGTNLRANFSMPISTSANVDVNVGYTDRQMWQPFDGTYYAGLSNQMFTAPGYKTKWNGLQRDFLGDVFSIENNIALERFVTSVSSTWIPRSWLTLTAEGGVDNSNSVNTWSQFPGEGTTSALAWGPNADPVTGTYSGIDTWRTNSLQYTATGRAAATHQLTTRINTTTTVGLQWFKSGIYQLFGEGYGLGVGATTLTAASQRLATSSTTENATYGYFVSEQFDLNGRLFWTLAARNDQNSAFGRNVGTTLYPSSNISYVISEEPWFPQVRGVDRLRLRGSVGQAGLQPGTIAALAYMSPLTYPTQTGEMPGLTVQSIGNSNLKPEVTTEYEGGFDLGVLRSKVNLEFTYYNKIARDQLFQQPLPPSYGVGTGVQWVNLAKVQNRGYELAVDANLLTTRPLTWDVRLNGSHNANRLVTIGNVQLSKTQGPRNVVGYPIYGLWDRPYKYADANGDHMISASEITLDTADAYRGSTAPLYEAGFTNTLGLFHGLVNVMAMADYRGQFWNSYTIGYNRDVSASNSPEVNDPNAPLDKQAAAVATSTASLKNTRWGLFKPNDFIKLREVSVQFKVPDNFATRYLRARSANFVLSGRNLATLWTRYPGIDPEANRSVSNFAGGNDDLGTPPALRYFTARVNLGF